jgi:hypothetical protein
MQQQWSPLEYNFLNAVLVLAACRLALRHTSLLLALVALSSSVSTLQFFAAQTFSFDAVGRFIKVTKYVHGTFW